MPDFDVVFDYELLNTLAKDTDRLQNQLADPRLRNTIAPSPEEQRLVQIYRKKGPQALMDELKKF